MSGNFSQQLAECWTQGSGLAGADGPAVGVGPSAGRCQQEQEQQQEQQEFAAYERYAGVPPRDAYTLTLQVEITSDFLVLLVALIVGAVMWMRFSGFASRMATSIVDKIEARAVATSCKFVVALCEDPEVAKAASKLMASGINQWLAHPETQAHIKTFWSRAPDREVATQLGRNTPLMVKSFVDGLGQQLLYQAAHRVYEDTKALRSAFGLQCASNVAFVPTVAPS